MSPQGHVSMDTLCSDPVCSENGRYAKTARSVAGLQKQCNAHTLMDRYCDLIHNIRPVYSMILPGLPEPLPAPAVRDIWGQSLDPLPPHLA